jgi:hypothetical protein
MKNLLCSLSTMIFLIVCLSCIGQSSAGAAEEPLLYTEGICEEHCKEFAGCSVTSSSCGQSTGVCDEGVKNNCIKNCLEYCD